MKNMIDQAGRSDPTRVVAKRPSEQIRLHEQKILQLPTTTAFWGAHASGDLIPRARSIPMRAAHNPPSGENTLKDYAIRLIVLNVE